MISTHGVAYCDIAVGNSRHSAEHWVRACGFTALRTYDMESGQSDEIAVVVGRGGVELVVSSSLRPGGAAAQFVRDHGEGVRDIGLRVEDPDRAWQEAVRRGARPAGRNVAWVPEPSRSIDVFGSYTHTFVDADFTFRGEPVPDAEPMQGIDHFALAVPFGELEKWTDFYVDVLGFDILMKEVTETERSSMSSTVVRESRTGVTITLLEPGAPDDGSQINEFLTFNGGAGVQHIALSSTDIFATVDELRSGGVEFLTTPGAYYDHLPERVPALQGEVEAMRARAILADRDEGGELLQIFSKPITGRPTLFLELIERRDGASGFGAGNIKALFQALEAEQLRRGTL